METPKKSTFVGEITSISEQMERKGRIFRMVTFSNQVESKPLPVNAKFIAANANLFVLGTEVCVQIETSIANVTEYVDKDGQTKKHSSSGDSIRSIGIASKMQRLAQVEGKFNDDMSAAKATGLALLYGTAMR